MVRELLMPMALGNSAIIRSYATNSGNIVLHNEVNFNKSQLAKMSDEGFINANRLILAKAQEHASFLLPYGITTLVISDYNVMINRYDVATPKPKTGIQDKKSATIDLKRAFVRADAQLKLMDGMIRAVEFSNPDLYQRYFIAKKIDKPGHRTLAAQGLVTDHLGVPLAFVNMVCLSLGINRKVSKKGGFRIKVAVDGIHLATFSRTGYETVTVEISIFEGVRADIVVVMVPRV